MGLGARSATVTVEVARATVRPPGSTTRDLTSTSLAVPDSFTTDVRTRTTARSAVMSGVVTYVPQRSTCTGSVTTRRASR
jgi:hypothetical protein